MFYLKLYICSVYDSDGSLNIKACGKTNPLPIISTKNSLRIIFKTDSNRNAGGFKALWTTGLINSFHSPRYPSPYRSYDDKVNFRKENSLMTQNNHLTTNGESTRAQNNNPILK